MKFQVAIITIYGPRRISCELNSHKEALAWARWWFDGLGDKAREPLLIVKL
jgi:hypothetical protein